MEDIDNIFFEISLNYGCSVEDVKNYYDLLMQYPVVKKSEFEDSIVCLEKLVFDRMCEKNIKEQYGKDAELKSLEYSVSDALYRTYQDEAIEYLSNEYLKVNELKKVKRI